MSAKGILVPTCLFAGLAFGTGVAVELATDANLQADRLIGCEHPTAQIGATALAFCGQNPPESLQPQVADLHDRSSDLGRIGWLAGIGAGLSFVVAGAGIVKEVLDN